MTQFRANNEITTVLQFYPDLYETLQVLCQGLNMCMTLAVILRLIFVTFFAVRTKSILGLKHLDTGYLENSTPPIVLKLCMCFVI